MKRKSFIQTLAAIPLVASPFRSIATGIQTELCQTQRDAEGPFYKAAAPARNVIEEEGEPLEISGKIVSSDDCKTPVSDAVIDIWHCDSHGDYDMQGYRCRGVVRTDASGKYTFATIFPPPYGNRPRHIHFKIRAKGHRELTTQLYFEGDPNIRNDFARNAEASRVISLRSENNLKRGVFNIFL